MLAKAIGDSSAVATADHQEQGSDEVQEHQEHSAFRDSSQMQATYWTFKCRMQ